MSFFEYVSLKFDIVEF